MTAEHRCLPSLVVGHTQTARRNRANIPAVNKPVFEEKNTTNVMLQILRNLSTDLSGSTLLFLNFLAAPRPSQICRLQLVLSRTHEVEGFYRNQSPLTLLTSSPNTVPNALTPMTASNTPPTPSTSLTSCTTHCTQGPLPHTP